MGLTGFKYTDEFVVFGTILLNATNVISEVGDNFYLRMLIRTKGLVFEIASSVAAKFSLCLWYRYKYRQIVNT